MSVADDMPMNCQMWMLFALYACRYLYDNFMLLIQSSRAED